MLRAECFEQTHNSSKCAFVRRSIRCLEYGNIGKFCHTPNKVPFVVNAFTLDSDVVPIGCLSYWLVVVTVGASGAVFHSL